MKNLFLTLCCFLSMYSIHAQKLTPAVLINNNGDSIKCEIAYRRWDKNPKSIEVRGTSSTHYRPGEIKGFVVGGETYASAQVDVETSPYRLDELDNDATFRYRADTVFLQQLVSGPKSLYFLNDEDGKKHFYIFDGKFIHLDYKQYRREGNATSINSGGVGESRKYLGQLMFYFNDVKLKKNIETTRYEGDALTKLFTKYYAHNGEQGVVKERHEAALEMGVIGGAAATGLKFKGSVHEYLVNTDYDVAFGPAVGVFVDLKLLRTRGARISSDFMYTSFDISGSGKGGGRGTVEYTTSSNFKYQYLKTHHMFQLPVAREGKFYIAGGFTFGFVLQHEQDITILYETQTTAHRDIESSKLEMGVTGGAGTNFGRFAIDARYEWSSGITYMQLLSGSLNRVYVLAKYRLRYRPSK